MFLGAGLETAFYHRIGNKTANFLSSRLLSILEMKECWEKWQ